MTTQIAVQDGSFEFFQLPGSPGAWNQTQPDGWVLKGQGGYFKPAANETKPVPDGDQCFWGYFCTLFQGLAAVAQAGVNYAATVMVSAESSYAGHTNSYRVALMEGGITGKVVAESSGTVSPQDGWVPVNVSGLGSGSGGLGILVQVSSGEVLFDNFSVSTDAAPPAPPTQFVTIPQGAQDAIKAGMQLAANTIQAVGTSMWGTGPNAIAMTDYTFTGDVEIGGSFPAPTSWTQDQVKAHAADIIAATLWDQQVFQPWLALHPTPDSKATPQAEADQTAMTADRTGFIKATIAAMNLPVPASV